MFHRIEDRKHPAHYTARLRECRCEEVFTVADRVRNLSCKFEAIAWPVSFTSYL